MGIIICVKETCLLFFSYGFQKDHSRDALLACNGDKELALYLLYIQYINDGNMPLKEDTAGKYTRQKIRNFRESEMKCLKDSCKENFTIRNNIWTFKLSFKNEGKNFATVRDPLFLDVFLSPQYPIVPPFILLKPNKFISPPLNFQISKKLFVLAKKFSKSGRPVVHVLKFFEDMNSVKEFLDISAGFIYPDNFQRYGSKQKKFGGDINVEKAEQNRMIIYEHQQKIYQAQYKNIQKKRKNLPAWKQRTEILNAIRANSIILLKGETGCGKSTQVPQFIFDEWLETFTSHKKHIEIICTQPRRLSALGVATRVSDERVENVGHTVGYQIRFDHRISKFTRITFCTMGVLLKRLQREPSLETVTHILVDEVHERSAEG